MQQNELINLNICLSDIPADKRLKSEKNGKIYANFTIAMRREPDQNGNDISIWMRQDKNERGIGKIYVGSGKSVVFLVQAESKKNNTVKKKPTPKNDLPF